MKKIIEAVKNGEKNALQIFIDLKRSEKEIKDALSQIKDLAILEAEKYGEKVFNDFGVEISMKSGGGKWDYKHLDWWDGFVQKQKDAQLANKTTHDLFDKETSEVIEPAIYNANSDTISIKL